MLLIFHNSRKEEIEKTQDIEIRNVNNLNAIIIKVHTT